MARRRVLSVLKFASAPAAIGDAVSRKFNAASAIDIFFYTVCLALAAAVGSLAAADHVVGPAYGAPWSAGACPRDCGVRPVRRLGAAPEASSTARPTPAVDRSAGFRY